MNENLIKEFSNHDLLLSLENYFECDRKTTHIILLHLKEIQSRKLFADLGFPNLFTMLIQHFRQSESAANQRLQALKLMNAVPEVENRLIKGELNLSTLAMAQRQIAREEKATGTKIQAAKKTEIVERISSKTMAQAEKELMTLLPESAKTLPTHERRISDNAIRLSLTIPDRVKEKLDYLKNHWAAVNPNMDYLELIERTLDIAIKKVDPTGGIAILKKEFTQRSKVKQRTTESVAQTDKMETESQLGESNPNGVFKPVTNLRTKRKTYYAKSTDRIVWKQAGSQCEYIDTKTGRRCSSRFGLERDHNLPLGRGGTNEVNNLRLLCRTHNQLLARRHFGKDKIQNFINK